MKWLLARLSEPSTWRGLIWLATAAGVTLSPEAWDQIVVIGMAVAGLIGILTADKSRGPIESPPIELQGVPTPPTPHHPGPNAPTAIGLRVPVPSHSSPQNDGKDGGGKNGTGWNG